MPIRLRGSQIKNTPSHQATKPQSHKGYLRIIHFVSCWLKWVELIGVGIDAIPEESGGADEIRTRDLRRAFPTFPTGPYWYLFLNGRIHLKQPHFLSNERGTPQLTLSAAPQRETGETGDATLFPLATKSILCPNDRKEGSVPGFLFTARGGFGDEARRRLTFESRQAGAFSGLGSGYSNRAPCKERSSGKHPSRSACDRPSWGSVEQRFSGGSCRQADGRASALAGITSSRKIVSTRFSIPAVPEDHGMLEIALLTVHHCYMHSLMDTPSFKIIENHLGAAFVKQQVVVPVSFQR